jgi:hypothetical protein
MPHPTAASDRVGAAAPGAGHCKNGGVLREHVARSPRAHRSQVPRPWTDQALPISEEEVIAPGQVMVAS